MEINFDETIQIASTITDRAESVRELEAWLNKCVDSTLPSVWKGSGYEGYVEKVKSLKPAFDAMHELILEIGGGLRQNAIDYQNFDIQKREQNRR